MWPALLLEDMPLWLYLSGGRAAVFYLWTKFCCLPVNSYFGGIKMIL